MYNNDESKIELCGFVFASLDQLVKYLELNKHKLDEIATELFKSPYMKQWMRYHVDASVGYKGFDNFYQIYKQKQIEIEQQRINDKEKRKRLEPTFKANIEKNQSVSKFSVEKIKKIFSKNDSTITNQEETKETEQETVTAKKEE